MFPLLQSQYEWGFVSGRVSVLEGQLLPPGFYTSLLAQEKLEEMLLQLQGLPLETTLVPGMAWDHWTDVLERYYTGLLISLRKDCPGPEVVDFFILQGEYFNLKQALLKRMLRPFPKIIISDEQLAAAHSGDYFNLPDFGKALAARLRPVDRGLEPHLPFELRVDTAYLGHLITLAKGTGAPLIEAYARQFVLGKVILLLWRARQLDLPLGPYRQAVATLDVNQELVANLAAAPEPGAWPALAGGVMGPLMTAALEAPKHRQTAVFEQRLADELVKLAHHGHMQAFGPERVFSYLAMVAQEMFNLKMIVSGRIKNIEVPVLRRELRVTYG